MQEETLFEVSWEVCNKVGGIYTVISSKAARIMENYRNYFLVGPYFDNSARVEFHELESPQEIKELFETLKKEGIRCHYGEWEEVKGKPKVILIDFKDIIYQKNFLKEKYWNDYKIDSIRGYWDFEEPAIWSYAVGRLIEIYSKSHKKTIAQFHEWLAAFGLLHLKKTSDVATVFTTHATVLGRTLAGSGYDLYANIDRFNANDEAYKHNVEAKHLTEKAAALNADIFTTVSGITGIEAEKFLGRKPDLILPNGLDIERFPSFEETSVKHIVSREKIRQFMTYYFYPYYRFDMNRTLTFFTIGRYEFHNKGYDITIKALGKLNEKLRRDRDTNGEDRTIIMFFWIPMQHHGLKMEVLENKNYYMHINEYVHANSQEILDRIIYDFITRRDNTGNIFTEEFLSQIKRDVIAFERSGNPPMSTHNIDESTNTIVNALKENGLLNRKEDMVKIVIEPVYLDGTDGFIELTYYDSMSGCHLGLFPSYYEPWGYTPLESAALGVPFLTSDLSGFGMYLKDEKLIQNGAYVLNRLNRDPGFIIDEFTDILYSFAKSTRLSRVDWKMRAKNVASKADWKNFVNYYLKAHKMALDKHGTA